VDARESGLLVRQGNEALESEKRGNPLNAKQIERDIFS
jgi:hypothetical protein